jgi:hypothetical protein
MPPAPSAGESKFTSVQLRKYRPLVTGLSFAVTAGVPEGNPGWGLLNTTALVELGLRAKGAR